MKDFLKIERRLERSIMEKRSKIIQEKSRRKAEKASKKRKYKEEMR